MPSIFLSYRRDDSAGYAGRLRSSLESRLGAGSVFRDVDAIEPGQDFVEAIEARVQACRAFLVVIGQEWLDATNAAGGRRLDEEGDYVRREVAAALERQDLRVIPVLVEGAAVPSASELPEEMQALSRRHAVSLRDETWDSDVDRVADAIRKVVGDVAGETDRPGSTRRAHPVLWTAAGALAVLGVVAIPKFFDARDAGAAAERSESRRRTPGADARAPIRLPPEGVAVAVPRISEIELRDQIYSLVAASLAPRGDSMMLRLRFRVFNESRTDRSLGSVAVRLTAGSTTLPPSSSLTGRLPGRTVLPGDVTFVIPRTVASAVLIVADGETGELPLDLAAGGPLAAATDNAADESRAVGYAMHFPDEPVLLEIDGRRYSLSRVTVRQFANKHRVAVTAKLVNESRQREMFGRSSFRLALEDGSVIPPEISSDNDVVDGGSTRITQVVFEVPTTTRRVVLHLIRRDRKAEFPIELEPDDGPR